MAVALGLVAAAMLAPLLHASSVAQHRLVRIGYGSHGDVQTVGIWALRMAQQPFSRNGMRLRVQLSQPSWGGAPRLGLCGSLRKAWRVHRLQLSGAARLGRHARAGLQRAAQYRGQWTLGAHIRVREVDLDIAHTYTRSLTAGVQLRTQMSQLALLDAHRRWAMVVSARMGKDGPAKLDGVLRLQHLLVARKNLWARALYVVPLRGRGPQLVAMLNYTFVSRLVRVSSHASFVLFEGRLGLRLRTHVFGQAWALQLQLEQHAPSNVRIAAIVGRRLSHGHVRFVTGLRLHQGRLRWDGVMELGC